jgi:hypothetical protein
MKQPWPESRRGISLVLAKHHGPVGFQNRRILGGYGAGVVFKSMVGARDGRFRSKGKMTLLQDVNQLMAEQVPALFGLRRELAFGEVNLLAKSKGAGPEGSGGVSGIRIGMKANAAEVSPESRFKVSSVAGVKALACGFCRERRASSVTGADCLGA